MARQVDDHDVSFETRPLALHSEEALADIEGEVVPQMLGHGGENAGSTSDGRRSDLSLRDVALFV
jgi:hypothetical protein